MLRTAIALLAAVASAALCAWLILTNAYPYEGPYVSVSASHGVHVGDVIVLAAWGGLVLQLARWRAGRGRRRGAARSVLPRTDRPPRTR